MVPPQGRRERKKAQTRVRIQQAALDLFEQQGYAETSVEEISEEADVSTTTFFRYFRTKDETVAHNAFTPVFLQALRTQPAELDPLAAIRVALRAAGEALPAETWERERRRQLYVLSEPALRGPSLSAVNSLLVELATIIASHTDRPADDADVITFTGAILGVFASTILTEDLTASTYLTTVDRSLDFLAAGMPLRHTSSAG